MDPGSYAALCRHSMNAAVIEPLARFGIACHMPAAG
jgi:hypothetical protein